MLNVLKIFSLFVSIIIGAGFASGKELFSFFATEKGSSIYVIISSTLIFFFITFATLEISRTYQTKTYNQFLKVLFKNKLLITFFEICILFFMFVSFSSMLAGFTSLITQSFGVSKTFARVIFILLNFIVLFKGYEYILKLSIILVPLLIIGSLAFGYYYLDAPTNIHIFTETSFNPNSIFKGVTYSSYNLITAIAIVCALPNLYQNKAHNLLGSLLVSIILLILTVSILIPLFAYYDLIKNLDMPIYTILQLNNQNFVLVYLILMLLATLSTSVANAYAVSLHYSEKFKINYLLTVLVVIFCGVIFSFIGFSNIVNFVYPIFGFFGIIKILKIIQVYLH